MNSKFYSLQQRRFLPLRFGAILALTGLLFVRGAGGASPEEEDMLDGLVPNKPLTGCVPPQWVASSVEIGPRLIDNPAHGNISPNFGDLLSDNRTQQNGSGPAHASGDPSQIFAVPFYSQGDKYWCWAASTAMLLRFYGFESRPWTVAADLDKGPGKDGQAGPKQILAYLNENFHLGEKSPWVKEPFDTTEGIVSRLKSLLSSGRPVMVGRNGGLDSLFDPEQGGHDVIVTGFDSGGFTVHDPGSVMFSPGGGESLAHVHVPFEEFERKLDEPKAQPFGVAELIFAGSDSFRENVGGSPHGNATLQLLPHIACLFKNQYGLGTTERRELWLDWDGRKPLPGYKFVATDPSWHRSSAVTKADRLWLWPMIVNYAVPHVVQDWRYALTIIDSSGTKVDHVVSAVTREPERPSLSYDGFGNPDLAEGDYTLQFQLETRDSGGGEFVAQDQFSIGITLIDSPFAGVEAELLSDNEISVPVGSTGEFLFKLTNTGMAGDRIRLESDAPAGVFLIGGKQCSATDYLAPGESVEVKLQTTPSDAFGNRTRKINTPFTTELDEVKNANDLLLYLTVLPDEGTLVPEPPEFRILPPGKSRAPSRLVFVLDKSGSMKEEGRMSRAQQSILLLADFFGQASGRSDPHDALAVVSFDTGTRQEVAFDAGYGESGFARQIGAIQPDGNTDIGAGLAAGAGLLNQAVGTGQLILISDGNNTRGSYDSTVRQLASQGVSVVCIGLGDAGGSTVLKGIASETGGAFYEADALNLIQLFAGVAAEWQDADTLITRNGLIRLGETVPVAFKLVTEMGGNIMRVLLSWPGSRLGLSLKDGAGNPVDGARFKIVDRQKDCLVAEITGLAAGSYSLEIKGEEISGKAEPYNLTVFGNTETGLFIPPLISEVAAGKSLVIPMRSPQPMPDDAAVEIRRPDGTTKRIPFKDASYDPKKGGYDISFDETREIGFYEGRVVRGGKTVSQFSFRVGSVGEVLAKLPTGKTRMRQVAQRARAEFLQERQPGAFNRYVVALYLSYLGPSMGEGEELLSLAAAGSRDGAPGAGKRVVEFFSELLRGTPVRGLTFVREGALTDATTAPLSMRPAEFGGLVKQGVLQGDKAIDQRFFVSLSASEPKTGLLVEVADQRIFDTQWFRYDLAREASPNWAVINLYVAYQVARNLPAFVARIEGERLALRWEFSRIQEYLTRLLPHDFPFFALELKKASGEVYLRDAHSILEGQAADVAVSGTEVITEPITVADSKERAGEVTAHVRVMPK